MDALRKPGTAPEGAAPPTPRGGEEPPRIAGWVKTTLLDYPGKVASTLFLRGCNFRCPYCHNPELVDRPAEDGPALLDPEDIFAYFSTFSRLLEGVCISGGEPLLQKGLPSLCRRLASLGLKVKLDTNGSQPEKLGPLIEENLLDYVAVDVKGPPGKLGAISRAGVAEGELVRSLEATVEILKEAGIRFELRTTVVPGLLGEDDLHALAVWMKGAPRFVLQQFRPGTTLDPSFREIAPYPPQTLRTLAGSLSGFFGACSVRGVGDPSPASSTAQPRPR